LIDRSSLIDTLRRQKILASANTRKRKRPVLRLASFIKIGNELTALGQELVLQERSSEGRQELKSAEMEQTA
jgi:hypothetical protein